MTDYHTNERIQLKLDKNIDEALQKIKEAGNINEAAFVVSYTGLELLSTILGNTIQSYVQKAVEENTKQVLEGFLKGIHAYFTPNEFAVKPSEKEESPKKDKNRNRWTEEEDELLLSSVQLYLDKGFPVKSSIPYIVNKFQDRTEKALILRYALLKKRQKEE